jgi:hypothetical protein
MRLSSGIRAFVVWVAVVAIGHPVLAAPPGEKQRTEGELATDTVTQPLADINIKKKGVPVELTEIRNHPYALNGIRTCNQIIAEVVKLDAVLGDDFDQIEVNPVVRKRRETAAGVAGGIIAGLIPFRALIREVSGARSSDEDYREAVYAGVVRRSFLKGLGQARRCKAPGRPLTQMESASDAASEALQGAKQ